MLVDVPSKACMWYFDKEVTPSVVTMVTQIYTCKGRAAVCYDL